MRESSASSSLAQLLFFSLLLSAASSTISDPASCSSVMTPGSRRKLRYDPCGETGKNESCILKIVVDDPSDPLGLIVEAPRRMYDGQSFANEFREQKLPSCTPIVVTLRGELLVILGNCSSVDDLAVGIYDPLLCDSMDGATPDFYGLTRRRPGSYELNCSVRVISTYSETKESAWWEARVYGSWEETGEAEYGACVKPGGRTCTNLTVKSRTCPYLYDFSRNSRGQSNDRLKKIFILGACILVGSVFLLFLSLYSYERLKTSMSKWRKRSRKNKHFESFLQRYQNLVPTRYKYSDIEKFTSCFSHKLGQGGYGCVYKGKLEDGRSVAVKLLNDSKGSMKDFFAEVITIGCTYHVNIVTLLGFCSEGPKRVLIYEFMPNGSLEKFIYNSKHTSSTKLDADKMLQIATGVARGLEYLHHGCNVGILHFDIKPHNILLDHDFCPKVADFGLAKICRSADSRIEMLGTRGTVGYIAPEVFSRSYGGVSGKSDVYSYGMMILEMIAGRKNITNQGDNTSDLYYSHWICKHLDLDGNLKSSCKSMTESGEETVRRMVIVGLWCIQTIPSNRPSMTKVLDMLEGRIKELVVPPLPTLCSPSNNSPAIQSLEIISTMTS
ncbi:rust resistance kinase Lr10 isoform X1 [Canna indica]|uniref:Rust resistance kinase Lr10 isoform X1 n=1 Tax=Canna indica TaxID=4628 RepID=A0AAQ3QBG9_9LILI|nr:rust resistance kinase Lr10 isoform X1 [Canna indica]